MWMLCSSSHVYGEHTLHRHEWVFHVYPPMQTWLLGALSWVRRPRCLTVEQPWYVQCPLPPYPSQSIPIHTDTLDTTLIPHTTTTHCIWCTCTHNTSIYQIKFNMFLLRSTLGQAYPFQAHLHTYLASTEGAHLCFIVKHTSMIISTLWLHKLLKCSESQE